MANIDDCSVFFCDRNEFIWANETKLRIDESKKGFGRDDSISLSIPNRLIVDLEVIVSKTSGNSAFDFASAFDELEGSTLAERDFLLGFGGLSKERGSGAGLGHRYRQGLSRW